MQNNLTITREDLESVRDALENAHEILSVVDEDPRQLIHWRVASHEKALAKIDEILNPSAESEKR